METLDPDFLRLLKDIYTASPMGGPMIISPHIECTREQLDELLDGKWLAMQVFFDVIFATGLSQRGVDAVVEQEVSQPC